MFDSNDGGLIAADTVARYIREQTGYPVRRIVRRSRQRALWRSEDLIDDETTGAVITPKQMRVAAITNKALKTAAKVADAAIPRPLIVMVCNTACTSGETSYGQGVTVIISDLINVTSEAMINHELASDMPKASLCLIVWTETRRHRRNRVMWRAT